jgi:predicted nucleotidyltransferase
MVNLSPSTQNLLAQLRNHLQSLYGERLHKVMLFGSYARGEARPDSDIDVLVVLI